MRNSIFLMFIIFTSINLNCQIDQLQYQSYLLIGPMEYETIDDNIQQYYSESLQNLKKRLIQDLDYISKKDSLILEKTLFLNISNKGYTRRRGTNPEIRLMQFFNKHYPECGKDPLSLDYDYLVVKRDTLIELVKKDILLIEKYQVSWEEVKRENQFSKFLEEYEDAKCYEIYSGSLVYRPEDYELIIQKDIILDTLISEINTLNCEVSGGWKPKIISNCSLDVNCKIIFYTKCVANCEVLTSVGYKSIEYLPLNYNYNKSRSVFERKILIPRPKYILVDKITLKEIMLSDWKEIQCN